MDATLIVIDSNVELARARALVDRLWDSDDPTDIARLAAQARLIAAYEEEKWPRRPPSTADLIRHLMDQHALTRADLVPILGTASRVSEVLRGKKGLSMRMVQRLHADSACRPNCCFRLCGSGLRAARRNAPRRDPVTRSQQGAKCGIGRLRYVRPGCLLSATTRPTAAAFPSA